MIGTNSSRQRVHRDTVNCTSQLHAARANTWLTRVSVRSAPRTSNSKAIASTFVTNASHTAAEKMQKKQYQNENPQENFCCKATTGFICFTVAIVALQQHSERLDGPESQAQAAQSPESQRLATRKTPTESIKVNSPHGEHASCVWLWFAFHFNAVRIACCYLHSDPINCAPVCVCCVLLWSV